MKFNIEKANSLEDEYIEIDIEIADSFFKKLKGLMFKEKIDKPLMFFKCKQVHTFFMRVTIDIYYFDKNMLIMDIEESLSPNRIGKYKKNAYGIIEASANSKLFNIGDKIVKI